MRFTAKRVLPLTLLVPALLTGCASTPAADSDGNTPPASAAAEARADITPIASSGAVLRVNGMSCPKCANNIDRQLRSMPGVADLSIDLGLGVVRVGFDEGAAHPSRADLASAIDRTGFTLVSITPAVTQ